MQALSTVRTAVRQPAAMFGVFALVLILAGAAVGQWVAHWQLSEEQDRFWDIALKGLGGVVALSGAAVAVVKYFDDKQAARDANERAGKAALAAEREKVHAAFVERRRRVFDDLIAATSVIGNVGDPKHPAREAATTRFWRLYWGQVPLVSDAEVDKAIDDYSIALHDHPENGVGLLNAGMDLARACRRSLGEG